MIVNIKLTFIPSMFLAVHFFTASTSYSADYTIIQLTDKSLNDNSPPINDNGNVVWQGYDGSDWEIIFE